MKNKVLLLAGLLVGFTSSVLQAEDYQYCEVTGIILKAGVKSARLSCLTGTIKATWTLSRQVAKFLMTSPSSCATDAGVTASLTNWKNSQSQVGYCMRKPDAIEKIINNIDDNITFFYMSLKEDIALKNVSIATDKFIAGELTRHMRLNDFTSPMRQAGYTMSNTGGSGGSMMAQLAGGSMMAQLAGGSMMAPTTDCKSFKEMVDQQVMSMQAEQTACKDTTIDFTQNTLPEQ